MDKQELLQQRKAHVEAHRAEFNAAVEKVFDLIKKYNLSGKRSVRLDVGELSFTKWNYHIAEMLGEKGFSVGTKKDKVSGADYLLIKW